MAQTSNLKFLYHIVCMLITVILLDSLELKSLLFFSSRVVDGYFGDLYIRHFLVIIKAKAVKNVYR